MSNLEVRTGYWVDYTGGNTHQAVVTVPLQYSGFLISALTLLVSVAGTSFWTIVAYALHQRGVIYNGPTDLVHLQRQVLLRNVPTPFFALLSSWKLWRAWSHAGNGQARRLAVVVVFATGILALFTAASLLVASIASRAEDSILVLARPERCGLNSVGPSLPLPDDWRTQLDLATWTTAAALRGRAYAKAWYSLGRNSTNLLRTVFPATNLPYSVSQVPCPFPDKRCSQVRPGHPDYASDPDLAVQLDTGMLHSRTYLGINAPDDESMEFRMRYTCSSVYLDNFWVRGSLNGTEAYLFIDLGGDWLTGNLTNPTVLTTTRPLPNGWGDLGYQAFATRRSPHLVNYTVPAPVFETDDAIVSLSMIQANDIRFASPVLDPVFQATTPFSLIGPPLYVADQLAGFIGCRDQAQYCNPVNGRCTAITDLYHAHYQAKAELGINDEQDLLMERLRHGLEWGQSWIAGVGLIGTTGMWQLWPFTLSSLLPPLCHLLPNCTLISTPYLLCRTPSRRGHNTPRFAAPTC